MNDFSIDRRSKIPYEKQLQLILRSMISSGVLSRGTPLQDSKELAAEVGMDPAQVLKAYALLEKEKRVVRHDGTWLVATSSIPKTFFNEYVTIYESIRRNTLTDPSIKTLELDPRKKIKGAIAKALLSTSALYTKRLYFGDENPYVLINAYYPDKRFSGFENELAKNLPYSDQLLETYGIRMSRSVRSMNGISLKKNDADLLGVPEGTAVYHTIVENHDQDDRIYEIVEVFSIAEIMHFTIEQPE